MSTWSEVGGRAPLLATPSTGVSLQGTRPDPPQGETSPRPLRAGLEGQGPLLLSPDPLPPAGRLVWRSLPGSTSRGIPEQRRCTRSCATTSRRCTGRSRMGRSRCASPSTRARSWRPTSLRAALPRLCAAEVRGLRGESAGGVQLQGPGLLPVVHRPADERDGGELWSRRCSRSTPSARLGRAPWAQRPGRSRSCRGPRPICGSTRTCTWSLSMAPGTSRAASCAGKGSLTCRRARSAPCSSTVRRIERHLRRRGLLGIDEDDADPDVPGDPETTSPPPPSRARRRPPGRSG